MVKRQKKIVVWIITWAGLLLIVLYSPIGSPDLYTSRKYFTANQGVQFNGAGIENAPAIKAARGNDQELNVPVYDVPELENNATYPVSTPDNSNSARSGNNYASESSLPAQKNGNSDGGSGGIGGSMGSIVGKTSKETVSPQTNGFMALNTDLNGLTNKQSTNNYLANSGATDPGSDNPTGAPIPVGDGWGLFILFGVCYALYKNGFILKKGFPLKKNFKLQK